MNRPVLVRHRQLSDRGEFLSPFLGMIADRYSSDVIYIEDFDSAGEVHAEIESRSPSFTVIVAKFRWLRMAAGLRKPSQSPRIFIEHDAGQNYLSVASDEYMGEWSKHYPLLHPSLVAVADRETADRLQKEGIPAFWLPKASGFASPTPVGAKSHAIGSYGSLYGARAHAVAALRAAKIPVHQFDAPYFELQRAINAHRAILVCNMAAKYRFSRLKALQKKFPIQFIIPSAGFMVMAKNYEVCLSGSLMLADAVPELRLLGFESEKNCLLYSDTAELLELARWIVAHPHESDAMAAKGQELVVRHHTWSHRLSQLSSELNRRFGLNLN